MFVKLKQRWNVNNTNLVLIFFTFALGGSLCGYLGRLLLSVTRLESGPAGVILYIIIVTLLWPLCVLLISILLGQFSFFRKYLEKVWARLSGKKNREIIKVAIFASGAGSNAEKIIQKFNQPDRNTNKAEVKSQGEKGPKAMITLIVCNKPGAGVLQVAKSANIETLLIDKDRFLKGDHYLPILKRHGIDFIVLAGFLWKIPAGIIQAYPNKIVNIHPALLPRHGGKGMYGAKVHEAVIAAGDKQSGITIHYVDELYDHGNVILQATCDLGEDETPETLAEKIHLLEHEHYPALLERLLQNVK